MSDLYSQMGDELRSLFKDLFSKNSTHLVYDKMKKIVELASQIGSPIKEEAAILSDDVMKFLKSPQNPRLISIMKKHALRLEQETKEL